MRMRLRERWSAVVVDWGIDVSRALLIWVDESPLNPRIVTGGGWLNGHIAWGYGRWWSVSRVATLILRLLNRSVHIGVHWHVRAMPGNVPRRRRVKLQYAGGWSNKE